MKIDLTYDEMHAVSAGFTVAREHGFVTKKMDHKHPNVVLVRSEIRIALRKMRDQGLTRTELESVAEKAAVELIKRQSPDDEVRYIGVRVSQDNSTKAV